MGYIAHDAVIVTVSDYVYREEMDPRPKLEAFRASLPDEWRPLVIGPVHSLTNGYDTYVFLPDGSKEGWDTSDEGDRYRARFLDIFTSRYEDGSSPFDYVALTYGGDFEAEMDHPRALGKYAASCEER